MTMPTIPRILTTTALCLAAVGLSSCLITHQQLYEQSFSCDGVWIEQPDTIYQTNGKNYVRGVRAQFVYERNHSYIGLKEGIIGPSEWKWEKVSGSEGELVYKEMDDWGDFKKDSAWVSLDLRNFRTKKLEYPVPSLFVDKNKRHLTSRAFYGLPGAALCFIPDIAGSVVMWTAYGTGMVIQGIVLVPVSHQQQQIVTDYGEKPVVE